MISTYVAQVYVYVLLCLAQIKYRDRAKERREKHGQIEPIIPKWKRDYDEERLDSR